MTPGQWLARVDFRPAVALRLVCFAHAGSGAAPFIRWASKLPERVALCPIRTPGRETAWREPPLRDVPGLADGAFAALSTLPAKGCAADRGSAHRIVRSSTRQRSSRNAACSNR